MSFMREGSDPRLRELRRLHEGGRAVPFGLEPRLTRCHLVELVNHDLKIGPGDRLVEADENLACGHALALAHPEFTHHATRGMLHLLDVCVDHELARRYHGAREIGGRGPKSNCATEKADQRSAGQSRASDSLLMHRCGRSSELLCHGS
jgi:hypothetical protein